MYHGLGEFVYKDDWAYTGQWFNGRKQGYGKIENPKKPKGN